MAPLAKYAPTTISLCRNEQQGWCYIITDNPLMSLILCLHCHWKLNQSGTVLKIAPCWPLTGSAYTAIIKAVWVLSIFDLKGGMSGSASRDIYHHGEWFMVSSSVCKRNAQEGTKHTECSYTVVISLSHVFETVKHTSSAFGMARVQHRFGSILFTLAGEKVLVPCQLALSKRAGPVQHGLARHNVGMLWSCLHCHC